MFQLLRLKFSITAHCFQVNSLAIRLANVLKNSSRFSCWNCAWKSGRDSILSLVTILSNLHHGWVTLKDSADPARGFVLKFPNVTSTVDGSVSDSHFQMLPETLPCAETQNHAECGDQTGHTNTSLPIRDCAEGLRKQKAAQILYLQLFSWVCHK